MSQSCQSFQKSWLENSLLITGIPQSIFLKKLRIIGILKAYI